MSSKPGKNEVPLVNLEIEIAGPGSLKTLGEVASLHLKPNSAALRDAQIIGEMIRKANGR